MGSQYSLGRMRYGLFGQFLCLKKSKTRYCRNMPFFIFILIVWVNYYLYYIYTRSNFFIRHVQISGTCKYNVAQTNNIVAKIPWAVLLGLLKKIANPQWETLVLSLMFFASTFLFQILLPAHSLWFFVFPKFAIKFRKFEPCLPASFIWISWIFIFTYIYI